MAVVVGAKGGLIWCEGGRGGQPKNEKLELVLGR